MIEIRVHATVREIPEAAWDALLADGAAPFLRWAWLDALERTGCVGGRTGWASHHLGFYEKDTLIGAAPAYLKGNSEGEFVFDHQWAGLARRLGLDYYPKLLVAAAFTPATDTRVLGADRDPRLLPALAEAVRQLVEAHGISSAHVNFPPEAEAAALEKAGLAHRYGIQFHWVNRGYASWDDYLKTFNAKRRHQVRRERREIASTGVTVETLSGAELTPPVIDAMFAFYVATVDKFSWGRRYLNRAFFEEVCARVPGVEIVIARDGSRPIAGALNLASSRALYGRYWGATEERPFLHFEVCYYHSIERAIARGLERFEPGAGGEHKVARGFDPTVTHSLHHLADPRLDAIVRDYLIREREAVERHVAGDADDEDA